MSNEASARTLPMATGYAARRAIEALRARGLDVAPLLARIGLTQQDFDGPRRRISAEAQALFLQYAAEALGDSAFGLHLARDANPREIGLLFYAVSAAKDLEEALALIARYARIVNEAARLKVTRTEEGVAVDVGVVGVRLPSRQHNIEFGLAVIVRLAREIVGRNVSPLRVTFMHARNLDLREFERFFGCPVEFGAQHDRLVAANETLALPTMTGDPYLLETLQPFCEQAARERHTLLGSLRGAVESEAQKLLPHGKANRETIAGMLAMSERTLSRRLAEERTSFEEVVDELRRTLAIQYIRDKGISLSQISWLLGYGGSTSFNHAFRRWTGQAPSAARKPARRERVA